MGMFDGMLESLLPPGVTVESITKVAQDLAVKMVQLAADVATIKAVQAEQDAMLRQFIAQSQAPAILADTNEEKDHEPATPDDTLSSAGGGAGTANAIAHCPGCVPGGFDPFHRSDCPNADFGNCKPG